MRQLTAKQKLATLFSVTVFGLTIGFSIVFISLYSLTLRSGIKRELALELANIIENHLTIHGDTYSFVKDKTGTSLRQHLSNTETSVIFYDKAQHVVRTYGLMNTTSQKTLQPMLKEISEKRKTLTKEFDISNEKTLVLGVPLMSPNNSLIGTIILTHSLSSLADSVMSLVYICMGLSVISLFVSFIIGYVLMRRAFRTLDVVTETIMKIDLNRLGHKVDAIGHPDDEIVQLATKFNEMIERLKTMSQKQKEFVANASHELKTPLARIISTFDALGHNENADFQTIRSELFGLSDTIEQLLLLGKMREHEVPFGNTHLRSAIEAIIERLKHEITSRNVQINVSIPSNLTIPMPEAYAHIVMANIISNALKYSHPGQSIEIGSMGDQSQATFWVQDHGSGMSEQEVSKMFDRFYRASNSQGKSGSGIGLSLVKTICDMYSIRILPTSQKDVGTTITLSWENDNHAQTS